MCSEGCVLQITNLYQRFEYILTPIKKMLLKSSLSSIFLCVTLYLVFYKNVINTFKINAFRISIKNAPTIGIIRNALGDGPKRLVTA